MPNKRQPLFLARANYRKRRLRDGARMLPIFGAVLMCFPWVWTSAKSGTLVQWAFVFGAWAGLIALAALLSRPLIDADMPAHDFADEAAPAPPPPAKGP